MKKITKENMLMFEGGGYDTDSCKGTTVSISGLWGGDSTKSDTESDGDYYPAC